MQGPTTTDSLIAGLKAGDRTALARAITLVESTRPTDAAEARRLLDAILPGTGKALRLGITGIPGVGKSTLIDALGQVAVSAGRSVAVLATDPSSPRSGGSILGDKTRMEGLSRSDRAFIRPTPSSGMLGGVARRTRETILLCEAAGHDLVLVETVGVGQSELDVDGLTDLNVLLTIAGAGDELQGIKRGIMESADVVVITKAGSTPRNTLLAAQQALSQAIPFLPARDSGRRPAVLLTDALTGQGLHELWDHLLTLGANDVASGHLQQRRRAQNVRWMEQTIAESLQALLHHTPGMDAFMALQEERVKRGEIGALSAAEQVLEQFRTAGGRLP